MTSQSNLFDGLDLSFLDESQEIDPNINDGGEEWATSSETINDPFDPSKVDVELKNMTLDLLIRRMRHGEIDLTPSFQRKEVWQDKARTKLIESLLIRIPLPAFYIDGTNENKWAVVDGLQRLSAIRKFVVEETLALNGLEFLKGLEGKKFSELPRDLQRRIEEAQITVYLIRPGTPENVKFNIFKRINTGGLPLSPQEIRHALNQGPATAFLAKLAGSDEFLQATANGVNTDRMSDQECVLRFVAFYSEPRPFKLDKDFDFFLHRTMQKLNSMSKSEREVLEQQFSQAMRFATLIFGKNAFRKPNKASKRRLPFNKALFDCWSVALARRPFWDEDVQRQILMDRREQIVAEADRLADDSAFVSAISQGTADPNKIRLRFDRVETLLREVLNA